ncbi:MAG: hypothetical protein ACXWJJ_04070 [Ramlibacter sp.]
MLLVIGRRAWEVLLALLPGPVLRGLDGWAQRQALARAERRRRALLMARSRS